jgi:hypothetical protein
MQSCEMALVFNPRYLQGKDPEDYNLRPAQVKKIERPYLNQRLDVVACACHPSYTGKYKREDWSPDSFRHKVRPYLKNNQC